MPFFFLAKDKINVWAHRLADEYQVYFPALVEDRVHFQQVESQPTHPDEPGPVWALDRIRASEPMKAFLFAARETVSSFPNTDAPPGRRRKQVIIGAKNCDIMPLQVHRRMFLERDHIDPFYKQRLTDTVIISADCPTPESTCFCSLLGLAPYVESGSDINLTALENGYLVEPVSATGNDMVFGRDKPFRPATEDEVGTRDLLRRQAVTRLREINPKPWNKDLPDRIEQANQARFWREAGVDCVECFGCLKTCPTCFCYLLYDQGTNSNRQDAAKPDTGEVSPATKGEFSTPGFDRVKVWDACYYEGYARVGGGANARPVMWERFRNRFHCKWMNCTRDWGFHSCSGCGRCFTACLGKIDIRKILGTV